MRLLIAYNPNQIGEDLECSPASASDPFPCSRPSLLLANVRDMPVRIVAKTSWVRSTPGSCGSISLHRNLARTQNAARINAHIVPEKIISSLGGKERFSGTSGESKTLTEGISFAS